MSLGTLGEGVLADELSVFNWVRLWASRLDRLTTFSSKSDLASLKSSEMVSIGRSKDSLIALMAICLN